MSADAFFSTGQWNWGLCGVDNDPLTFTSWHVASGEPNNAGGNNMSCNVEHDSCFFPTPLSVGWENCAHTAEIWDFQWNDIYCDYPMRYLACQVRLYFLRLSNYSHTRKKELPSI